MRSGFDDDALQGFQIYSLGRQERTSHERGWGARLSTQAAALISHRPSVWNLKRSLDQSESVGEKMENNERDRKMMRHKIWGVQSVTDLSDFL